MRNSSLFHLAAALLLCLSAGAACAAEAPAVPTPTQLGPLGTPPFYVKKNLPGDDLASIIGGGWGYTKETATVVTVPKGYGMHLFSPEEIFRQLIDIRNTVEFMEIPSKSARFAPVEIRVNGRKSFSTADGRSFEEIGVLVLLLPEKDGPAYNEKIRACNTGDAAACKTADGLLLEAHRTFFFDVTAPAKYNTAMKQAAAQNRE